MSAQDEMIKCVRCRKTIPAEGVQCEFCGEVQAQGTRRGINRADKLGSIFDGVRGYNSRLQDPADFTAEMASVPPVPLAKILRISALLAAGLFATAGVMFGLAWVWDDLSLELAEASLWCGAGGVLVILGGAVTLIFWGVLHRLEQGMISLERKGSLRRQRKRQEYERRIAAGDLPRSKHFDVHLRDAAAKKPSPWVLSFGLIGIVSGAVALMFAVVPLLGLFSVFALVPAILFSGLGLGFAIYEKSQKHLAVVGLALAIATIVVIGVQFAFWNAFEEGVRREEIRRKEQLNRDLEEAGDQMKRTLEKIFK